MAITEIGALLGTYQGERELSEGFAIPKDPAWWRAGDASAGEVFTRPFPDDETTESPASETVLRSDEVSREAISFAQAPVVIQVTDEQAEQLSQFHKRGASPQ
jgi:hypothetical protein